MKETLMTEMTPKESVWFDQGWAACEERIIKLLESSDIVYDFRGCGCCSDAELKDVIALIKGEK